VREKYCGWLKTSTKILTKCGATHSFKKAISNNIVCIIVCQFCRHSQRHHLLLPSDADFDDMCDCDKNYMPVTVAFSSQRSSGNGQVGDEDEDMNVIRDNLANALFTIINYVYNAYVNISGYLYEL
jgi:hypothetical protein